MTLCHKGQSFEHGMFMYVQHVHVQVITSGREDSFHPLAIAEGDGLLLDVSGSLKPVPANNCSIASSRGNKNKN